MKGRAGQHRKSSFGSGQSPTARQRPFSTDPSHLRRTRRREGPGDHLPLLGGQDPHHGRRRSHLGLLQDVGEHRGRRRPKSPCSSSGWCCSSGPAGTGPSPTGSWPMPSPSSAPACPTSSISTSSIPYAGTTLLWAVVLVAIFWVWHRSEGTLSIHSITTRRREGFYWATVFATFALGTALGDFTATASGLATWPRASSSASSS